MELKEILTQLKRSAQFKSWQKAHPSYFLAHVFKMMDEENADSWQVGYCNPGTNAIMTFMIEKTKVKPMEESAPFNKPGVKVKELNMDAVLISNEEAIVKAELTRKANFPNEPPIKLFYILQNIDGAMIYNITFFTQTFKALNIRVSAETGEVVKEELNSFFNFDRK